MTANDCKRKKKKKKKKTNKQKKTKKKKNNKKKTKKKKKANNKTKRNPYYRHGKKGFKKTHKYPQSRPKLLITYSKNTYQSV